MSALLFLVAVTLWAVWLSSVLLSKHFYGTADEIARSGLAALHPTLVVGFYALKFSSDLEFWFGQGPPLAPLPLALTGTLGLCGALLALYFRRQSAPEGEVAPAEDAPPSPVMAYWIGIGLTVGGCAMASYLWSGGSGSIPFALAAGAAITFPVVLLQGLVFGILLWRSRKRDAPLSPRRLLSWTVIPLVVVLTLVLGELIYSNRPRTILERTLCDPLPPTLQDARVEKILRKGIFRREYTVSFTIERHELEELVQRENYERSWAERYVLWQPTGRRVLDVAGDGRVTLAYAVDFSW